MPHLTVCLNPETTDELTVPSDQECPPGYFPKFTVEAPGHTGKCGLLCLFLVALILAALLQGES